jgi:hypothetical protein
MWSNQRRQHVRTAAGWPVAANRPWEVGQKAAVAVDGDSGDDRDENHRMRVRVWVRVRKRHYWSCY